MFVELPSGDSYRTVVAGTGSKKNVLAKKKVCVKSRVLGYRTCPSTVRIKIRNQYRAHTAHERRNTHILKVWIKVADPRRGATSLSIAIQCSFPSACTVCWTLLVDELYVQIERIAFSSKGGDTFLTPWDVDEWKPLEYREYSARSPVTARLCASRTSEATQSRNSVSARYPTKLALGLTP